MGVKLNGLTGPLSIPISSSSTLAPTIISTKVSDSTQSISTKADPKLAFIFFTPENTGTSKFGKSVSFGNTASDEGK